MKAGSYLLDTNAIVAYVNEERKFFDLLSPKHKFFISATVLGELYFGAHCSAKLQSNLAIVKRVEEQTLFLPCDDEMSRIFGMIKSQLRAIGKPIPDNDVWIAAIAMQYNLPLISRDKHFASVPNLDVVAW